MLLPDSICLECSQNPAFRITEEDYQYANAYNVDAVSHDKETDSLISSSISRNTSSFSSVRIDRLHELLRRAHLLAVRGILNTDEPSSSPEGSSTELKSQGPGITSQHLGPSQKQHVSEDSVMKVAITIPDNLQPGVLFPAQLPDKRIVHVRCPEGVNYLGVDGFNINMSPLPPGAKTGDTSSPPTKVNSFILENQKQIFEWTKVNGYPGCNSFASQVLVNQSGLSSVYAGQLPIPQAETLMATMFADAIFECPTCTPFDLRSTNGTLLPTGSTSTTLRNISAPALTPNSTAYFNGTLWLTKQSFSYPYAFINLATPPNDPNGASPSLLSNTIDSSSCPANVEVLSLNSGTLQLPPDPTTVAMTYLNLLSNTIIDPNLNTYGIQGAYSTFGLLQFNFVQVSGFISFILALITTIVFNVAWTLSIWRLSYERFTGVTTMMKSIGLSSIAYYFGMYMFDTILQSVISVITMIVAVELKLSQFNNAPLGYLIITAILSAHAFSGMGMLLVRLGPKSSRLTTTISYVFSLALSVGSMLLIFLYFEANNKTWPNALSLIPWFAQSRAVYKLLMYHKTDKEVDTALGLLFFVGTFCFLGVVLIEERPTDVTRWLAWGSMNANVRRKPGVAKNRRSRSEEGDDKMIELNSSVSGGGGGGGGGAGGGGDSGDVGFDLEEGNLLPNQTIANTNKHSSFGSMDDDVLAESYIALRYKSDLTLVGHETDYAIVIQNLHQSFPPSFLDTNAKPIIAVKELSLALKYGETFGLLGPNGAGKSTTLGILTGFIPKPTSGKVYIAGFDKQTENARIQPLVGFCAQDDIFWYDLTVEEHLVFQARQRGLPSGKIKGEVQRVARIVKLDGDGFHTPAGKLSGGMKRRLSIGMAIVGDPPILFFDEMTAGLDPENRNVVWSLIQSLKSHKRIILLTTHGMDEAESLCDRVGIISAGELRCVGTPMHLKAKFGKGYTLTVNMNPTHASINANMSSHLPIVPTSNAISPSISSTKDESPPTDSGMQDTFDIFVRDELGLGKGQLIQAVANKRKYTLPKQVLVSNIFIKMEGVKDRGIVREWGIAMSTLEDVFIASVKK